MFFYLPCFFYIEKFIIGLWKEIKTKGSVIQLIKRNEKVEELKNATLENLLIQPVQRVMRYPMVMKEIVKLTSKQHEDYRELKIAYNDYHSFSQVTNERSKMRDSLQQVSKELELPDLIVFNRYHLKTYNVVSKQETKLHLFNDMIMVCTKKKNGKWEVKHKAQISADIDVSNSFRTLTVKKYGETKPFSVDLETDSYCFELRQSVSDIIRDGWYNLNDDRSFVDFIGRTSLLDQSICFN